MLPRPASRPSAAKPGLKRPLWLSVWRAGLFLTLWLMWPGTSAAAQGPVVRVLFFYAQDCPHCLEVRQEVLPLLHAQFGSQMELHDLEISDPAVYGLLLEMEDAYRVPGERATIPEMFIGQDALLGETEIREGAAALIERHLAEGGADWPEAYVAFGVTDAAPAPKPSPTRRLCPSCVEEPPVRPGPAVVHLYYFGDRLCEACVVLEREFLTPLQATYGDQLKVDHRDLESSASNHALLQGLEAAYGVTESRLPQVYIGKHALVGESEIREWLQGHIDTYLAQGGASLPLTPVIAPQPTATATAVPPPAPEEAAPWPYALLAVAVGLVAVIAAVFARARPAAAE